MKIYKIILSVQKSLFFIKHSEEKLRANILDKGEGDSLAPINGNSLLVAVKGGESALKGIVPSARFFLVGYKISHPKSRCSVYNIRKKP